MLKNPCRFNFVVALLILLLAGLATGLPALSQESAPRFVRVPIFYVTDRNLQSNTAETGAIFGPHRKYIYECQHDPFMGSGYCVVENTVGKQLTPARTALGWSAAGENEKAGASKAAIIGAKDFNSIQEQFYANLRQKAMQSNHKEIVLFAHGYKNSFEAAWQTAAKFSYQFETPVILYSWPSVAKLRSYSSDENNNEWSQEHFNDVLVNLEQTCTANPSLKLRIFAHSMGSRLVIRGTPFLRERPHIAEVAVVCPDVDMGLVKHYARRYLSTNGTCLIRLYMSQRDKALALSQILHGGYCRLGECADSIASLVSGTLPAKAMDSTDDAKLNESIQKTKHRMQTIDFTAIDTGAIGHKIPVALMHSMSSDNTPSTGLKLISAQSGERSRTSKVLSRITRTRMDALSPADTCFKVVKVADAHKRSNKNLTANATPIP